MNGTGATLLGPRRPNVLNNVERLSGAMVLVFRAFSVVLPYGI